MTVRTNNRIFIVQQKFSDNKSTMNVNIKYFSISPLISKEIEKL